MSQAGSRSAGKVSVSEPPAERRPRVLWVAEAANPKLFSVSLIGWSFGRALRETADGILVTEQRNRDDCRAAGAIEGGDFETVDNRFWQGTAWRVSSWLRGGGGLGWTTYAALSTLVYPIFELRLWKQFRDRLASGQFDLVHRLTPVSPVTPSPLAQRCAKLGVPFALGPLNGGLPWPKEYPELRRAEKEWLSPLRGVSRLLPGFEATRRHSSAIIVASRSTLGEMAPRHRAKCVYLPENAIDPERFPRRTPPVPRSPVRVVFVGRLVPYKGADLLIEAAAPLLRAGSVELDIVGDGPEMPRLRRMASDLNVENRVEFAGWVDHARMADRMGRAQVFGFPSLREFGGGVVLEAMALGLAPVVVDYGGPGELTPAGCGWTLPMAPRAELVARLRATLSQIGANPAETAAIGRRAQEYAYRNFTWPAKARQMVEIYRWVLGRRDKPDWGVPMR